MKKIARPLYFIRNLDTNSNDLWYSSCIKEAEKFEKNNHETFHIFHVINKGHNFYMTEKGFKTIVKTLNLVFLQNKKNGVLIIKSKIIDLNRKESRRFAFGIVDESMVRYIRMNRG